MRNIYVMIFGALGALLRYGIGEAFNVEAFPYGTLIVNVVGCFLITIIFEYIILIEKINIHRVYGLGTGFVGAFTTFSSFSVENANLIAEGLYLKAFIYIGITFIGGILGAILGYQLALKLVSWEVSHE